MHKVNVIVITRRHVGGIPDVNKNWTEMRKSGKKILCQWCFAYIIQHKQKFASISYVRKFATLYCWNMVYLQHGDGS